MTEAPQPDNRRFPFSRNELLLHGTLSLFTIGLWLLVFGAIWAWRRGAKRATYALSGVAALMVGIIALSVALGEGAETEPQVAKAAQNHAATKQASKTSETEKESADASAMGGAKATTAPSVRSKRKPQTFLVREVTDGDTIVLANGKRVRLVQIDAPELKESECYSRRARGKLLKLLPPGKARIRLEYDPNLDKVDQYGRQLAYIFKGKESINLTLVLRGAASVWFYEGAKGRYADKLDAAALNARTGSRGLWGACSATEYDPFNSVATKRPAPPPPLPPAPEPTPTPSSDCHPSYEGACLDPNASDYDCAGGSGNGPLYTGPVRVVGYDEYDLDRDGDGYACEG